MPAAFHLLTQEKSCWIHIYLQVFQAIWVNPKGWTVISQGLRARVYPDLDLSKVFTRRKIVEVTVSFFSSFCSVQKP